MSTMETLKSCFICKKFEKCYPKIDPCSVDSYILASEYKFKVCDNFEIIDREFIESKNNSKPS